MNLLVKLLDNILISRASLSPFQLDDHPNKPKKPKTKDQYIPHSGQPQTNLNRNLLILFSRNYSDYFPSEFHLPEFQVGLHEVYTKETVT